MKLLEIHHLTKHFGGLAAVSDLDFNVNKGEILGLIGPNGAGKTTVFNLISGVYSPRGGKIIFKGKDITYKKPHQVAKLGIVRTFQANICFPKISVLENMLLGYHLEAKIGFGGILEALANTRSTREKEGDIREKAISILDFLGLVNFKDDIAENLPHGHQRILGIAIALAVNPELLLLDEPLTGMHPKETLTIMGLINKIRDGGITIIVVEHNMKAIMDLSDRIVVMNHGKKIAEGLPREIIKDKAVIEAYLGDEEDVT